MNLVFSKGHDGYGLQQLLALPFADMTKRLAAFHTWGPRKIVNPRAGFRRSDTSLDATVPPPPADDSRETAGELLEAAAMQRLIDHDLDSLDSHPDAGRIAEILGAFPGILTRPGISGMFRYGLGDLGRRTSVLLWKSIPMGWDTTSYEPLIRSGRYGSTSAAYMALQVGQVSEQQQLDLHHQWTGRALASLVHQDQPYLIPLFVACQLLSAGAPLSTRFPAMIAEAPFVTAGGALALQCALATVTEQAMRSCWAVKFKHGRERPERLWREGVQGNLHPDFLKIGGWLVEQTGDYLPMTYAEGSPLHPDYPSGHATIAGACAGILLAWFADGPLPALEITSVHDEIRQMMWALAVGRSWAGIHSRSSLLTGLQLGMSHSISFLRNLKARTPEPLGAASFAAFDGTVLTV